MTTSSKRTPSPTNGKKPPIVGFVTKLKDMIDGDGSSSDIISVRKQIVIIELFFGSTRCYTEFNIVVLYTFGLKITLTMVYINTRRWYILLLVGIFLDDDI